MDLKNHLQNSKDIPQFVSYGTEDSIVGNGPKEYVEKARAQKFNIAENVAQGQNHGYAQKYYMKDYINWIKGIFDKKK